MAALYLAAAFLGLLLHSYGASAQPTLIVPLSETGSNAYFPPKYNPASPFIRFVVIGDWGRQYSLQSIGMPQCSTANFTGDDELLGASQQRQVSKLMDEVCQKIGGCQFVLSTGDNFYHCGVYPGDDSRFVSDWRAIYKNPTQNPNTAGLKWYNTFGNHDIAIQGSVEYQIAYGQKDADWVFADTNYMRDWSINGIVVRGIFLDTNPWITKYNKAGNKYNTQYYQAHHNASYVNATIQFAEASILKSPKPTHIFITAHYPLFGGATQYAVPGGGGYPGEFNGWQLLNDLVNKYNVTAFFNGHDHHLGLVTGANTYQNATNQHTVYVTSGAGSILGISDACGSPGATMSYSNGGNGGFAVVTANATTFQVDYFSLGSISSQCTVTSTTDLTAAPVVGTNCAATKATPACCATSSC